MYLLGTKMKFAGVAMLILPLSLAAEVFHCQSQGDTYYSQIPCDSDSKAVQMEDRRMFADSAQGGVNSPAEQQQQEKNQVQVTPEKNIQRSPEDGMREFVQTLERQRSEQLLAVDRQIATLESRIEAIGNPNSDHPERMDLGRQLVALKESRGSISFQYDSMISETERRFEE
jgi:hypothetical protein